jgi:hypothetical protein
LSFFLKHHDQILSLFDLLKNYLYLETKKTEKLSISGDKEVKIQQVVVARHLSQSEQRLPQVSQSMMAGVSPSSWLSQEGRSCPLPPPPHSPLDRPSTWSLGKKIYMNATKFYCSLLLDFEITTAGLTLTIPKDKKITRRDPVNATFTALPPPAAFSFCQVI